MPLSDRARLALASFATGLTGTDFAGIVQKDLKQKQLERYLDSQGIDVPPGMDINTFNQLQQARLASTQREAEEAFLRGRAAPTRDPLAQASTTPIPPADLVRAADALGVPPALQQSRILDPRGRGIIPPDAPMSLVAPGLKDIQEANIKGAAKEAEKAEEAQDKASQQATAFTQFAIEFSDAFNEVSSKIPDVGSTGIEGKLSRFEAKARNFVADEFPIAAAFEDRKLVLANKQARAVEGGRVTDKDRETYANAMASVFNSPTQKNITLASGAIMDIFNAPADREGRRANIMPLLDGLSSVDNPVLNKVVDDVIRKILLQGGGGRIGVSSR